MLDDLATSELLIVPHLSSRGPNGIWTIERGENHPLVLAADKLQVYALFEQDGHPDFYCRVSINGNAGLCDSDSAKGIDLFTSLRAAREWIKQVVEDGEPCLIAKLLTPHELLSCLSRVDIPSIDLVDFAMTQRGKVALGHDKIAATKEVLQALAG